uniref:PDZ domain-containing protein n=1 Tax=Triticum urartu TaxID=4572 RepID=A0A8R7UK15_TRIUA
CGNSCDAYRRVVQPWFGLRIGSLQAQKLGTRVELHNSFPGAHGIYVERVFDGSPAANSGTKVGDVITKLDEVPLFSAQEFHNLVLDKTESTMQHCDVMPFEVSVLRPGNSFDFCATINAEVIDMSKQNRWPVPKTKWLYPDNKYDDERSLV